MFILMSHCPLIQHSKLTRRKDTLHARTPGGKIRLLDVEVVLNGDKGIQQTRYKPEVMKERDDTTTHYAILSHRWGAEVNYEEMVGLMKMEEEEREEVKQRDGYQKILKSCEQAAKDGYKWLWIDTCCIDKRSSAELSEAINSMYRWYQNAQICYAYLNDVGESTFPTKEDDDKYSQSNGWPEWFVRGWTLQELIAPKEVEFFNKGWVPIGNKRRLAPTLQVITGIPCEALTSGMEGKSLTVAQIMSWATNRKTTLVEDRAYSLMGLFGVHMPMLYGEGEKAFQRLQLEIIRKFSNQSMLPLWVPRMLRPGSDLAMATTYRNAPVIHSNNSKTEGSGCCVSHSLQMKKVEPDESVERVQNPPRIDPPHMSALKLKLSRGDPLQTDFLATGNKVLYTSETITYPRALHGSRATTAVTRRDAVGGPLPVGVIEWPANPHDRPRLVIGTKSVEMKKTGLYASPEKFQAQDGRTYEWQASNFPVQVLPCLQGFRPGIFAWDLGSGIPTHYVTQIGIISRTQS
ncbi:heterokaryon incompatibility protein-domain-containing protein [Pisolithus microcarpus]|nr:heterokaryon incompatibility protein-domain-containing protein [Pisolithus microcarpus]